MDVHLQSWLRRKKESILRVVRRSVHHARLAMSAYGGRWSRVAFLPLGIVMFFETNQFVGFRDGPVLTWLFFSFVLCAVGLYSLKRGSLVAYGLTQVLFGAAITFVAINAYSVAQRCMLIVGGYGCYRKPPQGTLQLNEVQIAVFGMLAAIYVIVRGLDDVGKGLRKHPKANACWQRCFGGRGDL